MQALDLNALSYEQALDALEQTLRALEEGNQTLDEAIALFERGMRLAQRCSERLDAAELRIKEVQVSLGSNREGLG